MSYRLIDSNEIAIKYPEVNEMDCIYVDLPNGLDNEYHYIESEPKHGRWIKRGENLYECSKCGAWVTPSEYIPLELHKFCRGCGAKMDEAEGSYTIDAELVGALLKDEVEE